MDHFPKPEAIVPQPLKQSTNNDDWDFVNSTEYIRHRRAVEFDQDNVNDILTHRRTVHRYD